MCGMTYMSNEPNEMFNVSMEIPCSFMGNHISLVYLFSLRCRWRLKQSFFCWKMAKVYCLGLRPSFQATQVFPLPSAAVPSQSIPQLPRKLPAWKVLPHTLRNMSSRHHTHTLTIHDTLTHLHSNIRSPRANYAFKLLNFDLGCLVSHRSCKHIIRVYLHQGGKNKSTKTSSALGNSDLRSLTFSGPKLLLHSLHVSVLSQSKLVCDNTLIAWFT